MSRPAALELVLWVEGVTDADVPQQGSGRPRAEGVAGALVPIIRRTLIRELGVSEERFDRLLGLERIRTGWLGSKLREARQRPGPAKPAGLDGWARKLMIALLNARARAPTAMVIAVWDRDTRPEHERRRDDILRSLRDSGHEGLAVGLCVEEVEAWLLADSGCFKRCLGAGPAKPLGRVETLENPKKELMDLLDCHPGTEGEPLPMLSRRLAEHVDLDVLERACRLGFGMFVRSLRDFIVPVITTHLSS